MKERKINKLIAVFLSLVMIISVLGNARPVYVYAKEDIAKLSITYHLESEDGNMIAEPYYADMPIGSGYDVPSPEIENYVLKDEQQKNIQGTLDKDTNIKVVYTYDKSKEIGYTINYIGRNSSGEETILETVNATAPAETILSVPYKEFGGYYKQAGQDMMLRVTSDGNAEKNIYYEKADKPYIIFQTNGSYVEPIMAEAGTDISEQIENIQQPTRQGYDFAGWDKEIPKIMPNNDLIINAEWKEGISNYRVVYWGQNAVGNDYSVLDSSIIREAKTNEIVTASAEDKEKAETTDRDNIFYGYDFARSDEVKVCDDGSSILNVYYDRGIWTVHFMDDIYYENLAEDQKQNDQENLNRTAIWKTFKGRYGAPVPDDYPTMEEINAHYKANGVCADNEEIIEFSLENNNDVYNYILMGGFGIEGFRRTGERVAYLYPVITANPFIETTNFYCQTIEGSLHDSTDLKDFKLVQADKSLCSSDPNTGSITGAITSDAGFTFENGFYRSSETEEGLKNKEFESMTPHIIHSGRFAGGLHLGRNNVKVLAYNEYYVIRQKYNIEYISNGKVVHVDENIPYEYIQKITFQPPEEEKSLKFEGWFAEGNEDILVNEVKMPAKNITLIAKWKPGDKQVIFDSTGGNAVPSQTVEYMGKSKQPENPEREGYIFRGWYTSPDGEERWSFDRPINEDTTLYAHWRPIAETGYTVRHIMQGENGPFWEDSVDFAGVGDTVAALPVTPTHEKYPDNIYLKTEDDSTSKTLVLKEKAEDNVVTFTYVDVVQKDYAVKYLNKVTKEEVAPGQIKTTRNTVVTENALSINNFKVDGNTRITQDIKEKNEIIFYYVPRNLKTTDEFKSATDKEDSAIPQTGVVSQTGAVSQTGDSTNMNLWLSLLATSGLLLGVLAIRRKKKKI